MTKHKIKTPNPLNFYDARRVQVLPPHFESIDIDMRIYNMEQTFVKWITDNLKGRFYIGNVVALAADNQYYNGFKVGFENPKELSYFTLACPYLKYK